MFKTLSNSKPNKFSVFLFFFSDFPESDEEWSDEEEEQSDTELSDEEREGSESDDNKESEKEKLLVKKKEGEEICNKTKSKFNRTSIS